MPWLSFCVALRVFVGFWMALFIYLRPQIERDPPAELKHSISGGRETNRDSLSNGERSGKKPRSEISRSAIVTAGRIVVWRGELS